MKKVLLFILLSISLTSCSIDDKSNSNCGIVINHITEYSYDYSNNGFHSTILYYLQVKTTKGNYKLLVSYDKYQNITINDEYCW